MDLSDPSPGLLEAASRTPCAQCDVARASWATGGYHLSCRGCEIRAVVNESIAARQAFYSGLVAEVDAVATRGGAQGRRVA
jgi:hypothetical protein